MVAGISGPGGGLEKVRAKAAKNPAQINCSFFKLRSLNRKLLPSPRIRGTGDYGIFDSVLLGPKVGRSYYVAPFFNFPRKRTF